MVQFALIYDNRVRQLSSVAFDVCEMVWVDVTTMTPVPQIGWTATQVANAWAFTAPAPTIVDQRPLAKLALDASDVTVLRCYENNVTVPIEFVVYRSELRSIISGNTIVESLPSRPSYPIGT